MSGGSEEGSRRLTQENSMAEEEEESGREIEDKGNDEAGENAAEGEERLNQADEAEFGAGEGDDEDALQDAGEVTFAELTGEGGSAPSREDLMEALRTSRRVAGHLNDEVNELKEQLSSLRTLHERSVEELRQEKRKKSDPDGESNPGNPNAGEGAGQEEEEGAESDGGNQGGGAANAVKRARDAAKRANLIIDKSRVQFLEALGEGSGGVIFRGRFHGGEVAIKCKNMGPHFRGTDKEVLSMIKCRHPNVIQLFGVVAEPPETLWLVQELMDQSVYYWLHKGEGRWKGMMERLEIGLGIASGVEAVAAAGILHRDIKLANAFLSRGGRVKLGDFGLARESPSSERVAPTGETGTYAYMAPEVRIAVSFRSFFLYLFFSFFCWDLVHGLSLGLLCTQVVQHRWYSYQADVYSLGIALNELATGRRPFEERHLMPESIAIAAADKGARPRLPRNLPVGIQAVITSMWEHNPDSRPAAEEASYLLRNAIEKARNEPKEGLVGSLRSILGK